MWDTLSCTLSSSVDEYFSNPCEEQLPWETVQMPSIPQPRIACCLMIMTFSCKIKDGDSSSTNTKRKWNWTFSMPGCCCSESHLVGTSLKKSGCTYWGFFSPPRDDPRGWCRVVPVWALEWDVDVPGRLRLLWMPLGGTSINLHAWYQEHELAIVN